MLSDIIDRSIIAIKFYNHDHDHDNQNFCFAIVATCLCTCAVAKWSCANWKMAMKQLLPLEGCKSTVWKHFGFPARDGKFHKKKRESVICKLCGKILKYSGNTTNLFYHLQHSHHTEFKAMQEARQQGEQERMMKMKDLRQGKVS